MSEREELYRGEDLSYSGAWQGDVTEASWGKLSFAGDAAPAPYLQNIKDDFESYQDNVGRLFDSYYGKGVGSKWKTYAGTQGAAAWRPGSAEYQTMPGSMDPDAAGTAVAMSIALG